ncbi:hypothetical protein EBT25_10060, partial [bacterium]|nr:hypothetical protein [bacterium]
ERVDLTQEEREQILSEWNAEAERIAQHKALQYQRDRAAKYPSIGDQLDMIYHNGLDAWKTVITAVKEEYPKP